MTSNPSYDLVILGSGPGGYVAAVRASQLGLKTALVEKDKALGGTCLLRGCVPTKFLLHAARLCDEFADLKRYGLEGPQPTVHWETTQREKAKTVRRLSGAVKALMKRGGVEVIQGFGRLAGTGTVEVQTGSGEMRRLRAGRILLATGSRPKMLPFLTRDGKRVITSDEALELPRIPRSLVVVGSGAVGSEFASLYRSFGTEVTLLEALPRLLPQEDEEISAALTRAFVQRGIACRTGVTVRGAKVTADAVRVEATDSDGKPETFEAEILLVAVSREPVTDGLGLETTSIRPNPAGFVEVNEFMQTRDPDIYAIGDLVPTPGTAHLASKEGILAVEHMAGLDPRPIRYETVPNAVYTDPEVASVGLTEEAARATGQPIAVGRFPFTHSTKAMISGQQVGLVKIVSETRYDEVLGVHVVGPHATELIGEAAVGMTLETTTEEFFRAVRPHPTLSEAVMEAAENLHGESIHI